MTGVCYTYNFVGPSGGQKPIGADYTGPEYGLALDIDTEGEALNLEAVLSIVNREVIPVLPDGLHQHLF